LQQLLTRLAGLGEPWPTWLGVTLEQVPAVMCLEDIIIIIIIIIISRSLIRITCRDYIVRVGKRKVKRDARVSLVFVLKLANKQHASMYLHQLGEGMFDPVAVCSMALAWRVTLLVFSTTPEHRRH
jgi:hypothetical protein